MRMSLPGGLPATPLFSDYLSNTGQARSFYARDCSLESIAQVARERSSLSAAHRDVLCSVLTEQQKQWSSGNRGIEKLAAGAVAVVTGQQPVLFSGPLFSIFKAASVVSIANHLEGLGIPAVPVFWVASEDHDFKEFEEAWVLNKESELRRVAVDLSGDQPRPAGWLAFREDVREAVAQCIAHLPDSEFIPELRDALEEAYKPGVSPVDAFARLMARLFSHTELTLINPLHESLRKLAQPTVDLAIRRNAEMRSALLTRNEELSSAGYYPQVRVEGTFTGFFAYEGQARLVVRPADLRGDFRWSPNVLLRPLVQDAMLPTVAYVGGPAEVAYFAQASAVYQTLGVSMPPIVPRISATVIEPRVARIMDKYSIELEDVFQGREHVRRKAVGSMEDGDVFEQVRTVVQDQIESLRTRMISTDATLAGALDTAQQKIGHQIETLKGKYVSAAARRDETVERHLSTISNSIFPEKKPQERVLNVVSLIARYGPGIVKNFQEGLRVDTHEHQVVAI